jgi:hypothetical protein
LNGPYNGRWFVNATLSTNSLDLGLGSSTSAFVTIAAGDFAQPGSYNFTTIATYGEETWRIQISAVVTEAPEPSLALLSYSYNSSTNATLILRNGGPASIGIISYNVTDSAGDSVFGCMGFGMPMGCYGTVIIGPSGTGALNVYTVAYCGFCSLRGNPFTYTSGQSYTIVVMTSRQNSFTYRITR